MEHGGPLMPEGQPDDDEGASPRAWVPPGDGVSPGTGPEDPDDDETSPRGWIPPDDRLWRHPSEIAKGPPSGRAPHQPPRRAVAAMGLGAVAAVAAAAALVLAGSAGTPSAARTATLTTALAPATPADSQLPAANLSAVTERLAESMVALRGPAGHDALGTGVVLPGAGNLVLTAASAVGSDRNVEVVTGTGRTVAGSVVGTDSRAGVAVVRLATTLRAADFADVPLSPDEVMMAACLCQGGAAGRPTLAVARVTQVGTDSAVADGIRLVDAIEADTLTPLDDGATGGVLIDPQGRVLGILDGEMGDGASQVGVFVPAGLAVGVADELASGRPTTHGWLGVQAADLGGSQCGADVVAVVAGSPAQLAGIGPGDVIDGVDGHRVCSVADLEARLYITAPGRSVTLEVQTGTGSATVDAVVGSGLPTG